MNTIDIKKKSLSLKLNSNLYSHIENWQNKKIEV